MKCAGQEGIDSLNQFWAGGTSPCSNDLPTISLKDFPLGQGKITGDDHGHGTEMGHQHGGRSAKSAAGRFAEGGNGSGRGRSFASSTIVDSILDWRNPNPDSHFNGAQTEYYSHLDPPYNCQKRAD